jgi:hypothetical protein
MDDTKRIRTALDEANDKMHAPRTSPAEFEKARLRAIVDRCVALIVRDRPKLLEQLDAEGRGITEEVWSGNRPNQFLPMPTEELAARLWDGWTEEEREEIVVEAGYYILDHKAWFRVVGNPELVEEPMWSYVIDPIPVGVTFYNRRGEPAATVKVLEPMSADTRMYASVGGVTRPVKVAP